MSAAPLAARLVAVIAEKGLRRLPEPVVLRSGQMSSDFVDVKAALAAGADLELACRAIMEALGDTHYQAVGGLTMGADQFAHGVALLSGCQWFVVRKEPKGRGTDQMVEGARIGPGTDVVLVEDAVTTGGSIQQAYRVVSDFGANVVAAVTCVDRGDVARRFFDEAGVTYHALVTYQDLGIDPIA